MKFVKKLTALFLAICMVMAMGITAFAAEGDKTLTISDPVAGHTYKVYQVLTGKVDEDLNDGQGTLSDMQKGSSLNSSYAAGSIDDVLAVLKGEDGNFLTGADLGDAAYKLIIADEENGITAGTPVATLDKDNTTAQVAPGYYIIVDESYDSTKDPDKQGQPVVYSRNMVAVVGDTTVTPKTSKKDIDKNIIDTDANKPLEAIADTTGATTKGKTDTAAIGDKIEYEIVGYVPNTTGYKYYYYVVNDTLSEGITFNDDIAVTIQKGSDEAVTLTKGTDYVVLTGDDAKAKVDGKDVQYTFRVAFKDMKSLYATYDEDAKITITYTGTINDNAVIGTDPNTNTANLTYSNNPNESEQYDKDKFVPDESHPQGETPNRITKTYVTQLDLFKVDQDGKPLAGATFELKGDNLTKVILSVTYKFTEAETVEKGEYFALNTNPVTYTKTAPVAEVKDASGNVTTKSNCSDYKNVTDNGNGTYTVTKKYVRTIETKQESTAATNKTVEATVDANGFLTFRGLNAGTYTLSEKTAPAGYTKIEDIQFTIGTTTTKASTDTEGGEISWFVSNITPDSQTISYNAATNAFEITIKNLPGSVLPSTGGVGTTVIYIAGIAMIVAAGVVVIARKRMA